MRCENCMEPIHEAQSPCPHCGYVRKADEQNEKYLPPGTKLGRYELGRVLGAGGFGITYIGWDDQLQRKVAIKEYFPSNLATRMPGHTELSVFSGEKEEIFRNGLKRFLEEARLLMHFSGHSGIVSIYDVFEANGTAYIVMEYLEGITLKQQISKFGVMDEKMLLACIMPVMLTLKFLHQDGYIHRDIAPDNLMYLPDGTVKLLDFGSARYAVMEASQTLSVIVKQGFTPIEQYQTHGTQGAWTDVYAVGATMYYALTGKVPEESLERMHKDTLKSPAQLGANISTRVDRAIMSALNVQPDARPQDLDHFIAMLLGYQPAFVAKKRRKFSLAAIIASIAAGCVMIAALIGIAIHLGAEEPEAITDGISVPDIIGQQIEEASKTLRQNQLALLVTGGRYYDEALVDTGFVLKGQIMSQDPESGISVDIGSTIGAEVSKGKQPVYMPDITDMLLENALQQLEYAGFNLDLIEIETQETSDLMPGTVISQETAPNTRTDFDVPQKLVVAIAPQSHIDSATTEGPVETTGITLEDLVGKDFDTLRNELLAHGIFLVKSAVIYSETAPVNSVVLQDPKPGTHVNVGEAVHVAVSLGIERTFVPDVQYLPLDEAKQALIRRGLSWSITYIQNPELAENLVASQDLEPDTQVDFGSVVGLEVNCANPPAENLEEAVPMFSQSELTLYTDETVTLEFTYDGSAELFWASSNESIVSVDQAGKLMPHRYGSATIILAADSRLAFCKVTVLERDGSLLRYSRVLTKGEVCVGTQFIPEEDRLDAEILQQLVWRTNSPQILQVEENGQITALESGFAVVTATWQDHVYQFSITVEEDVRYIDILRSDLNEQRANGERILQDQKIAYQVIREYSETVPEDHIIRIEFTGNLDDTHYHILEGSTVTLVVSAGKDSMTKLEITQKPTKMRYESGEKPDYTGMQLTATYRSGKTIKITSGYSAPFAALTQNNRTVTVQYGGMTASLTFEVYEKTSLSIAAMPDKTEYFIGDSLNLKGLKLRYTGTDGSVKEISNGYTSKADLSKSGTCTVVVSYENLSVEFSVNVKTPTITIAHTETNGVQILQATTQPADQEYTWSVTDPSMGYFNENQELVVLESGKITIVATMVYNGISYQDSITLSVETRQYVFDIEYYAQEPTYWVFNILTDIPGLRLDKVEWQVIGGPQDLDYYVDQNYGSFHVYANAGEYEQAFAVMAVYHDDGKTYEKTVFVTIPKAEYDSKDYVFQIYAKRDESGSPVLVFYDTTIPQLDPNSIEWSIKGLPDSHGWGAWENGGIFIDVYGLENITLNISAACFYQGKTYISSTQISI